MQPREETREASGDATLHREEGTSPTHEGRLSDVRTTPAAALVHLHMGYREQQVALQARVDTATRDAQQLATALEEAEARLHRLRDFGAEDADPWVVHHVDRLRLHLVRTVWLTVALALTVGPLICFFAYGGPDLSLRGLRNLFWYLEHDTQSWPIPLAAGLAAVAIVALSSVPWIVAGLRHRRRYAWWMTLVFSVLLVAVPTTWAIPRALFHAGVLEAFRVPLTGFKSSWPPADV